MDLTLVNWTLGITLGLMTFLFIFRIVLTWYPQVNINPVSYTHLTLPTISRV